MNISELDGYVAGLLVSPEMVMPSEWLPIVWGGDYKGTFAAAPTSEETLGVVMERYNRVAQLLSDAPEKYQALFGVDPNSDDTLWEPWVSGFEQAMKTCSPSRPLTACGLWPTPMVALFANTTHTLSN